jgi:hypothetical protein
MFKDGLTLYIFVDPNLIAVDVRENNPMNKKLDCLLSIIKK